MGNEHRIRHLLRLLPRQGHLELFYPTVPFVWVELRLFSRGLEGGIVAGRVGLERAGEVSSGTNRNTRRLRRRAISLITSGTDSLEDAVGSMVGGEAWSLKVASDGCVTSCI